MCRRPRCCHAARSSSRMPAPDRFSARSRTRCRCWRCPHAADQFSNADAVARAGAARVLLPDEVTLDAVRDAVADLLGTPAYREAAEGLAREIAAMPPPAETAERIEELCRSTT